MQDPAGRAVTHNLVHHHGRPGCYVRQMSQILNDPFLERFHELRPDVKLVVIPASPEPAPEQAELTAVPPAQLQAEMDAVLGDIERVAGALYLDGPTHSSWQTEPSHRVTPVVSLSGSAGTLDAVAIQSVLTNAGWSTALRQTTPTLWIDAEQQGRTLRVVGYEGKLTLTGTGLALPGSAPTTDTTAEADA